MKNGTLVGIAVTALLALFVTQTWAQVSVPVKAKTYNVNFARAMDECVGPGVTIVSPGNVGACLQANTLTDSTVAKMDTASLKIAVNAKKGPTMKLKGKGIAPAGTKIGLQLTLRTTNAAGSPSGAKTYNDETITCGDTDGDVCEHFFTVDTEGKLSGKQTLKDCLDKNDLPETLASGNIELLDAALINCDTGKDIAKAGLLQIP